MEQLKQPLVLNGTVVSGKGLGRTLGYPTANVQVDDPAQLPPFGVYACRLLIDGDAYVAVVNIGRHPTLPEGGVTVEVHALGERLALYGKPAQVELLAWLRPERRFDTTQQLEAQIRADAEQALAWFANAKT